MKRSVIKSAKTVDEAIKMALAELNTSQDNVAIDIIEQPSSGFLGLIGVKPAIIKVTELVSGSRDENFSRATLKPDRDEKKAKSPAQKGKPAVTGRKTKAAAAPKKTTAEPAEPKQKRPARKPASRAQAEEIAAFVQQLCDNITEGSRVAVEPTEDDVINLSISGDNIGLIVGKHGETLNALQYLTSLVYSKQRDGYHRVSIDAGGYREKRKEKIIEFSKRMADKAKRTGRRISLEPMNSYERRIIHVALQEVEGINTFSEGDDPNRRVVIVSADGDRSSRYNRSNRGRNNGSSRNNRIKKSSRSSKSYSNDDDGTAQRRAREERNYNSTEKKREQLEQQAAPAGKQEKAERSQKQQKPAPKVKPENNPYEHYYSKYDNRAEQKPEQPQQQAASEQKPNRENPVKAQKEQNPAPKNKPENDSKERYYSKYDNRAVKKTKQPQQQAVPEQRPDQEKPVKAQKEQNPAPKDKPESDSKKRYYSKYDNRVKRK